MRLVHFTQRSYVNDRLVEAGERVMLPDNIPLGAHMWDVSTGEHGTNPAGPRHTPVFLDHTGDSVQDSSSSGAFNPALSLQQAKASLSAPDGSIRTISAANLEPEMPVAAIVASEDDPSGD